MMLKAILFDLDDTLLVNDMNRFLPAYLPLLANELTGRVPQELLLSALLQGVKEMSINLDNSLTLEQAFSRIFFPQLPLSEADARPVFDHFYREKFGTLRNVTEVIPQAQPLLAKLAHHNIPVIIATNPLFPLTAITQRLEWAGLAESKVDFITSYETMHFAKPHPEYYAEILTRLGIFPDEALMVGNDWGMDIEPAHAIGMHTWWIAPAEQARPAGAIAQTIGQGSLADFANWVETLLADASTLALPTISASPTGLQARLRAAPAAAAQLCAGLSNEQARQRPCPCAYSAVETLGVLLDADRDCYPRQLADLLMLNAPSLQAFLADDWVATRPYAQQALSELLPSWRAARQELLGQLKLLTNADWQRIARHATFGPLHLQEWVRLIADHDTLQLKRLLPASTGVGDVKAG